MRNIKKVPLVIIVTFISKIVFTQSLFFPYKTSSINKNKEFYSFIELENATAEQKLNIEFLSHLRIDEKRVDSIKSEIKEYGENWTLDHNAYFEYKKGIIDKIITESYDDHHGSDIISNIHQLSYTDDNKVELIETTHSSKLFGYSNYERLNFGYNESGKISQSKSYYYDDEWIPSMSTNFTYDSVDISFGYNEFWYDEGHWVKREHKEFKLDNPDNLNSEYWFWYSSGNYQYYKESYEKEVINDTSFVVAYSSTDKDDNLYQIKTEYVIGGNNIETKKYRRFHNDTALSYFSNQELLFDELGRLLNERTFEYDFFPCDIEITECCTTYTRNEIDPDTIIIETDTVTTKYIYENNKITIMEWTQWGADCSYCNSEKITTYYLSDQTNSIGDENAINENKDFKIYPNPCNGTFIIESNIINTPLKIEIYNSNGQLIYNDYLTNKTKIKLPQILSGLYLIRIRNSEITRFQKLIIE